MMNLKTQIITLLVSIGFGFFFSLFLDIIQKYFFKSNKVLKVIFLLIFIISCSIGYFIILLKLNNAIIHPYYLIAFIISFFLEILIKKIIQSIKTKLK